MLLGVRGLKTIYIKISARVSTRKKPLLGRKTLPTWSQARQVSSVAVVSKSKLQVLLPSATKLCELTRAQSSPYSSVSHLSVEERLKVLTNRSLRKAGVLTSDMDCSILWPPEQVRGMKELDVEAFKKTIEVPIAKISLTHIAPALKVLKKYFLKLSKFNAIEERFEDNFKIAYLNPLSFTGNETKVVEEIECLCKKSGMDWNTPDECPVVFGVSPVSLEYKNWNATETLSAVLPLNQIGVSGYSIVGHIIHLNLKDHLDPYKKIIGKILLDKSPPDVTVVVNKVDTIDNSDNTFRCFSMEILAGAGDTVATIKENMCKFTFDFAKVYWNPRLSTEHETIVSMLQREDVLYDVMAGVGPFSIPAAALRKCQVVSNDLNPESFRWLTHNISLNKVGDRVSSHNLDGGEFIRTILKQDLLKRWRDPCFPGQIHVTMNLPSIAVEFLPNFVGLMSDVENIDECIDSHEICVHVYMFSKDQKASSCATRVAFYLGLVDHLSDFDGEFSKKLEEIVTAMNQGPAKKSEENKEYLKCKFVNDHFDIPGLFVKEMKFVRKVSPNKAMIRASVVIGKDILLGDRNARSDEETTNFENNAQSRKKIKLDADATSA